MSDYFKEDEYWKVHINKELEPDIWIREYKEFFDGKGKCLDLGCGIGQFSKELIEYGYDVTSADISNIALNKVKEFNPNVVQVDMREKLPFEDEEFDLIFANLSIHYFTDSDTKKLMQEIQRILKNGGLFIGSVNGIQGIDRVKDTAQLIEYHYYYNKNQYFRFFDREDLNKYLNIFEILKIDERETIRFNHVKNYVVFIVKK
jgi:SAM-dependent methyltransferase